MPDDLPPALSRAAVGALEARFKCIPLPATTRLS